MGAHFKAKIRAFTPHPPFLTCIFFAIQTFLFEQCVFSNRKQKMKEPEAPILWHRRYQMGKVIQQLILRLLHKNPHQELQNETPLDVYRSHKRDLGLKVETFKWGLI